MKRKSALITSHRGAGWTVLFMLFTALSCFFAGIFLPFTSVTKLWLFENQMSVCRSLVGLWKARDILLFVILFMFTICFPLVKMNSLLALWLYPKLTAGQTKGFYGFVSHLGKWSMLDVFVVAILALALKSGGVANIRIGDGFFFFFVSVMLTQFSSTWTGHIASRLGK